MVHEDQKALSAVGRQREDVLNHRQVTQALVPAAPFNETGSLSISISWPEGMVVSPVVAATLTAASGVAQDIFTGGFFAAVRILKDQLTEAVFDIWLWWGTQEAPSETEGGLE